LFFLIVGIHEHIILNKSEAKKEDIIKVRNRVGFHGRIIGGILVAMLIVGIGGSIIRATMNEPIEETSSSSESYESTSSNYEESTDIETTSVDYDYKSYERCFSVWDGSHKKVKSQLKNQFNDYDHIATRYFTNYSDYLMVKTEFHATNLYGVKAMYYAEAKVAKDSSCTVYSLNLY
jgi:hypothetical protein